MSVMRARSRSRFGVALTALAATVTGLLASAPLPAIATGPVVIPVGPGGIRYYDPLADESPYGPSALAVDADGGIWIANTHENVLHRYSATGTRLDPIDLAPLGVRSPMDVEVLGNHLVVLDLNHTTGRHRVLRLSRGGTLVDTLPVPAGYGPEAGLSGIAVDDGGVLLEVEFGARYARIARSGGTVRVTPVAGYRAAGRTYRVDSETGGAHQGTLWIGDQAVSIATTHRYGGASIVGVGPDGTVTVRVAEVYFGDRIRVDETLRRYGPGGRLTGIARRDLTRQHVVVEDPHAITPQGTVMGLDALVDRVVVRPVAFAQTLAPILPAGPARRLPAVDAVEAALVLSRETFAAGSADVALLARDDVFADALSSGSLQGAWGAPLLLNRGQGLDAGVARELARLGVSRVVVLGGTAAVGPGVVEALERAGHRTERLAGASRLETAAAVAVAAFPRTEHALLARAFASGDDPTRAFADSLAAGAWAAGSRVPVLLTETGRLSPATRSYLVQAGTRRVTVVGGTAAISDAVTAELRGLGVTVDRVAGAERGATATAIAARRGVAARDALLVEGHTAAAWAPGLAAAALAARRDAAIVLSNRAGLGPATASWLQAARPTALACAPFVHADACTAADRARGFREP